ncbi:MAG: AAA family ATPase [Candidatus Methanoplasma sp.]|jgi:nitrogenase iron protein|nr:AAA family ATPase [Candidatus Methanoplasma sp.]
MIQIAVYGKGGIGKSTVSANISYAMAEMGKRVLQIGCDPKHDSTRALLNGKEQTTVLSYIKSTPPYDRRLSDVVLEGKKGIKCVEAGGPEPGIGCAGRGILSTFDTLKKLGLDDVGLDVKVYDVLGDVVCGGFAVPLRNEYADGVYLVTSGEFMSMYAANNILKGIKNFDKGIPRVAGIILNCRGMDDEASTVKRFADAVSLPIIAVIPRSKAFAEAESRGMPILEYAPDSEASGELRKVAAHAASILEDRSRLLDSRPLNDEQMGRIAAGEEVRPNEAGAVIDGPACGACLRKKGVAKKDERIVASCAAAGAVFGCSTVTDSVTVIHGPRSCAHIMASSRNLSEIRRGRKRKSMSDPQYMRIDSTEMDDTVSVFGGTGLLERKLRDLILEGHTKFFVVTTCVSGIIGDNTVDVVTAISNEHPDLYFRVVEADGNILGDWEDGYIAAADAVADLVRDDVKQEDDCVNLIAERYFFRINEDKDEDAGEMIKQFGLKVNCRFMYEADMESIANFRRGRMNFIVNDDTSSRGVAKTLEKKLGVKVENELLPCGMHDFRKFAEKIGREFGIEERAATVLAEEEAIYDREIAELRKRLAGKRVIVESWYLHSVDWLIELILDLRMEIMFVGLGPDHYWKEKRTPSRYEGKVKFIHDYSPDDIVEDAERLCPDIVVGDSGRSGLTKVHHTSFVRAGVGVRCIIRFAKELADVTSVPPVEGWRSFGKECGERLEDERYAGK